MPFSVFQGNQETIARLRSMLVSGRFPHAVILTGPEGAGKYTLAQMLAKAMNCELKMAVPDFCGECSHCTRIAQADDLDARFAEAVEARESLRDADKKDTRILIQTHPDVLIVPPDPPQLLIKVGQVREVIDNIHFKPSEGGRKVFIFTAARFMKEAANSLLKVLEEPPPYATIFLLAENVGALLPTIRSRAITFTLSALPPSQIEEYLADKRPEWNPRQRALVARLSGGAIGKAQSFNLEAYTAARADALALLRSALEAHDHSALFRVTETYRAGADGQEKTDRLLRAAYSLLEDLLFSQVGSAALIRNTDIAGELQKLAASLDFAWLEQAAYGLGKVETGMRRNLLRSLSLDAYAVSLEK